jgi:hypothetical protein
VRAAAATIMVEPLRRPRTDTVLQKAATRGGHAISITCALSYLCMTPMSCVPSPKICVSTVIAGERQFHSLPRQAAAGEFV